MGTLIKLIRLSILKVSEDLSGRHYGVFPFSENLRMIRALTITLNFSSRNPAPMGQANSISLLSSELHH